MQRSAPSMYTRFYLWALVFLILISTAYCFWKPLVLSADSAYGFLSYKGSQFFHSFNVIPEIPVYNINETKPVFISWWSPGQWIYPGAINYFLGIRLGVAAIWVTCISLFTGFAGFYRIFIFYEFKYSIIALAMITIFSSTTLYFCFIIYQGGESLSFAFFPWFILYVIHIRRINVLSLIGVGILFALCFVAKTTLLVYCGLVLLARILQISFLPVIQSRVPFSRSLLLLLPAFPVFYYVGVYYLPRGPHPTIINQFDISLQGVFVPLTSPLIGVGSVQLWIDRLIRINFGLTNSIFLSHLFLGVLYLTVFIILFFIARVFIKDRSVPSGYRSLLIILYFGLLCFFLFAYSFGALIDFNARHFKLMGYLFVPYILTLLTRKFGFFAVQIIVVLFCLTSLTDFLYLKEKWVNDRYISKNYFYRSYEFPASRDKLDKTSYQRLLTLDSSFLAKPQTVFFIESTGDVAMDINHPFILQRPGDSLLRDVYHKSGRPLIICISKSTLASCRSLLSDKFPDYKYFRQISATGKYLFYSAE